jgi:hypothetical protein
MLANEARKNACEIIWKSLPGLIRYNIEDAVNEGKLNCEIVFDDDKMEMAKFNDCIKYFNKLNELNYKTAMYKEHGKYVITITW